VVAAIGKADVEGIWRWAARSWLQTLVRGHV